jgi:hypothetical protein
MKLPILNFEVMLFISLTILLLCGLYSTSTTALPVSSLVLIDADSASFDPRATTVNSLPRQASVPQPLAKRDAAVQVIVLIICVIVSIAISLGISICIYRYIKNRQSVEF